MVALIPNIGKIIRQIRKSKGLSLTDVREKTGIEANYLSRIETGKIVSPRVHTMIKIAKALNVTVEYIIGKAFKESPVVENPSSHCSECGKAIKKERGKK